MIVILSTHALLNKENNMSKNIANEKKYIEAMQADEELKELRQKIYSAIGKYRYTYNFNWLDRPIIQMPEDILMMQEIIFQVKPDLIIETGIAHGGSLIFSASMLEILGHGEVVGVDIDIRQHNREKIEGHHLSNRIKMIEGSSIDKNVISQVYKEAEGKEKIIVFLDSNHTHDHVLKELQAYSSLVSQNSYLVVFDTGIEDMPKGSYPDRPWDKGDNPKTAVWEFLNTNNSFEIDKDIDNRLMFSVAPDGYLKRTK